MVDRKYPFIIPFSCFPPEIPLFICYQDVLADGEGNLIVDISDYRTPKNKFTIRTDVKDQSMTDMLWKYYGYQTLDDLYKNVVTANESDYNHDDNVDASK